MSSLIARNLNFEYTRNIRVIHDVSLEIQNGEFLSIVGPNGSGKTTLLRLLDSIFLPQSGVVLLDGRNIQEYTRRDIARKIAFVPQEAGVSFPFTVLEVVLMGRSPHSRSFGFENSRDYEVANTVMDLLGISSISSQPVNEISGGERQRVFVARALAQEPAILLLDEPNAHLDIAHQIEVFSILKNLNVEQGLTVVSVSHDLNLASAYSHRIGMMMGGMLMAEGTPEAVLTAQRIQEVFRTHVLVDTHPSGSSPRITLSPPLHQTANHGTL